MTTTTAHGSPHRGSSEAPRLKAADRVTVALTARVSRELERLQQMTGLSKTDLVNRALSLYHLTQSELEEGHELAFYDPKTKEFRRVHLA